MSEIGCLPKVAPQSAPVSMEVRRVPLSNDALRVPGSNDVRAVPASKEPSLNAPPLPALTLDALELRRRMLGSAAAAQTCTQIKVDP